jgi:hypothetical protein
MGGVTTTLKVAHVRLCHSRMMFVRAYLSIGVELCPSIGVQDCPHFGDAR